MSIKCRLNRLLPLAAVLILSSTAATAAAFSSTVVYGDSLSDDGNLFAATGIPGAPYYQGRRSNGPVAVELLADAFGAPLTNFAWIGSTSGIGNYGDGGTVTSTGIVPLPGMQVQLALTQASLGSHLAGGLFIVWGGGNDFLAPSPLDATPLDVAFRAATNIAGIAAALQGLGAQHILVPGLPDLGLTPFFIGMGPVAAAQGSALTDYFNGVLQLSLPPGVKFYDTAGLLRGIVANPAAYGFTNVTSPCFDGVTVCGNPDEYVFFDDFHPTAATHAILASEFERVAVPEPSTFILAAAGLAVCAAARRSGQKAGRSEYR